MFIFSLTKNINPVKKIKIPDSLVINDRPANSPANNKKIYFDLYLLNKIINEKVIKLRGIRIFSNKANRDIRTNSGTFE